MKNHEVSIEPRAGLVFGDWLNGYTMFLVKWHTNRDTKVTKFWFVALAPWAGVVPIFVLQIYFSVSCSAMSDSL